MGIIDLMYVLRTEHVVLEAIADALNAMIRGPSNIQAANGEPGGPMFGMIGVKDGDAALKGSFGQERSGR